MKKRTLWITILSIVLVILVVGIVYTAHFASTVNQSQAHKAPGAIVVTATPLYLANIAIAQNKVQITLTFTAQKA
jgi:flagellar basal body-associated protein FliL